MSRIQPRSEEHRAQVIARKQDLLHALVPLMQEYRDVLNGEISGQNIFEAGLWLGNEIAHLKGESYLAQLQKLTRK